MVSDKLDSDGNGVAVETDRSSSRLLVISCSKRKRKGHETAPAIEVYDGPAYKILRKFNTPDLDVLIVSAKYGMIHSNYPIKYYDQRMTRAKADKMRSTNKRVLEKMIRENSYNEIYINLGKDYLPAISLDSLEILGTHVVIAEGPIGKRLQSLKNWLTHTSNVL